MDERNGFLGCLVGMENWRDFGRPQLFSPYAHQNEISKLERKDKWFVDVGLACKVVIKVVIYNYVFCWL